MTISAYWISAARRRIDRRWFNWRCRDILKSPPLRSSDGAKVTVVSQLYSPDLIMYLLAAKSFASYVNPRRFVIVDDGLNSNDREILSWHLTDVEFIQSSEVRSIKCPTGGTWERLITLSRESSHGYVVQLDADTLTVSRPDEVLACIDRARTFTLGTPTGKGVVSAAEASAFALELPFEHVQSWTERALPELPSGANLKYVRGCSGFTGFARGDLDLEHIEALSEGLSRLIGAERFSQWGSEQVVSNLMAANAPDSMVLPVSRYPFWRPGVDMTDVCFVHFFGTHRFESGMYMRHAREVIRRLCSGTRR